MLFLEMRHGIFSTSVLFIRLGVSDRVRVKVRVKVRVRLRVRVRLKVRDPSLKSGYGF